jgi:NADP-dependent 3-hydroxy acid dehydrogenase YdfG
VGVTVDLSGRRILVTGASSGIGAMTCRSLVDCGARVAMLARRKERLDELADELGERAFGVRCDVTDLDMLAGAVDEAARSLGGLDGVVAVAGVGMVGGLMTGTPERWRELLDLNLLGPLATARYAVEHFGASGRRDLVFVGSTGAITPMVGLGVYAASKRGLRAAADALRLEVAPAGVNVSIVMPGMFDTEGLGPEVAIVDGDLLDFNVPMFAEGGGPAPPEALADVVAFMLGLPEGVGINELVIRPTGQLNP